MNSTRRELWTRGSAPETIFAAGALFSPTPRGPVIVALVMIRCERDRISEAARAIAGFQGVSEVYSVTGEWDLVAMVRVPEWEEVARVVTEKIAAVDGLERTETHMAFRVLSKEDPIRRLSSKQRAHLRSLAHSLKPILQIGADGVTEPVLRSVVNAFNTRELMKVKVLDGAPVDVDEAADEVRDSLVGVHVVQTIGKTMVLYRPFPEEPEIELPE